MKYLIVLFSILLMGCSAERRSEKMAIKDLTGHWMLKEKPIMGIKYDTSNSPSILKISKDEIEILSDFAPPIISSEMSLTETEKKGRYFLSYRLNAPRLSGIFGYEVKTMGDQLFLINYDEAVPWIFESNRKISNIYVKISDEQAKKILARWSDR